MTLKEVVNQMFDLSVEGYFNHVHFTKKQLYYKLSTHFKLNPSNNSHIIEIALPDDYWYMSVIRYSDRNDGFDYVIPDNREQEQRLLESLGWR